MIFNNLKANKIKRSDNKPTTFVCIVVGYVYLYNEFENHEYGTKSKSRELSS